MMRLSAALLRRHSPPCDAGSMSKSRLVTLAMSDMSGPGRLGHGKRQRKPAILCTEGSSARAARSFWVTTKNLIHGCESEVVTLTSLESSSVKFYFLGKDADALAGIIHSTFRVSIEWLAEA